MEVNGVLRLSLATSVLFALLTGTSATAAAEPPPAPAPAAIAAPEVEAIDDAPASPLDPSTLTAAPATATEAVPLPTAGAPVGVARPHSRAGEGVAGPRAPPATA
ncbi:hypothetical protein [Couchioplanes caeruleus]|uniref:Uncharacterized protein n=1 Tax=Couchioplanes caeruleus subsp. caeruleus TaxID=56427 RepID=A0A1K0FAD0_9ACTN|nr:hypothetical protein [Couchioplanes caeruleus]OJF09696.1 hypothetical protein BG844_36110 [Couchioplanes caeruleus subsp. caeruleus]